MSRRSTRIKNLSSLDRFKHGNASVSESDSNKNTESDDDVSSQSSASESAYSGDSHASDEQYSGESESESAKDSTESDSGSEDAMDYGNGNDSDSDYDPTKRKTSKPKKKPPTKKATRSAASRQTRGRKRKRSESSEETDGDSDDEYKPSKRRKKEPKVDVAMGTRRSSRNLGKDVVKYDDKSMYGEVEGLYDEDGKEAENKKKEYRQVAKHRKRGGIKKLAAATKKSRRTSTSSTTSTSSMSPNSKRKFRLTHKAYQKKKRSKDEEVSSADESDEERAANEADAADKAPLYTYSSWLDDVVSDTECQYISRGRPNPGKINHVRYEIEVQTPLGLEKHCVEEGKLKPTECPTVDADAKETEESSAMDVDNAAPREWFQKLKVGDAIQILGDDSEQWQTGSVVHINRCFELQYTMRRSLNTESIWEYNPKTNLPNPDLRERVRPSASIDIEQTPEPQSQSSTVSPRNKRKKKKKRFDDSDDSDDSEEEESSECDNDDESQTTTQSRTMSISPIDDLQTKIEKILFRMKVPRSTVHYRHTFNHLVPEAERIGAVDNGREPTPAEVEAANGKEEMDVDADADGEEDKENRPDPVTPSHNNSMVTSDGEGEGESKAVAVPRSSQLVTKYLCKFWNRSYHHCEWLTLRQMRELEAEMKVQNYEKKWSEYDRKVKKIRIAMSLKKFGSIHFFNDLYLEIDRIISYCEPGETFDTVSGFNSSTKQYQINNNNSAETMYLVKWKGMQYDEATWEMESFLHSAEFSRLNDGAKEIELLLVRQKIPPSKLLHPAPKKMNRTYFCNRPSQKIRVQKDQVFKGGRKLRGDYQLQGVNWLINNWQYRMSCILADEMGLGKTVQTTTFINMVHTRYFRRGPFLIVAPLSTLGHWQRELRAWSDMNVIVYHGSASSRQRIQQEEFHWLWTDDSHPRARNERELKRLNANNFKFDVMITTPQIVNGDVALLNATKVLWDTIIVDEAHSLKSSKSLFYRTLLTYKNRFTHTVLLTGTPIQNNMDELWCLLHFLDPVKFDDRDAFVERFAQLADSKDELKKILECRLLQRLKYLVEKELGQREEKIIWVELTLFQKKWYKALYQKSYDKLKACGAAKASLMNVSMQLRKCCNHPFLMEGVEQTMSPPGTSEEQMNENLIASCGKLVLLDKLLPKLKREGHRVLIFSQMSHLLDVLEDYLMYRQHLYERLDGSVTGIERQESIDRFQKDDSIFCFLLTTRAGGVGINLMAADTVIIYDSDWNPMNDVQAIARAHRIGQKKQVNVYRLLTRNSYEESMFKRADQKLALNKVVMGDMKETSKGDIQAMLKKGAISMFLQDAQTEKDIQQFANADIDDILARRTELVTHDAEAAADPDAGMFSEAVFVANADDAQINVDDENFWEVLGIAPEEEDVPSYSSPFSRRRRTRLSSKNAGIDGYDSDGYSMDDVDDDDTTSLLGTLAYVLYGQWQIIFDHLTEEEKIALALINEDEEAEATTTSTSSNILELKTEEEYLPDGVTKSTAVAQPTETKPLTAEQTQRLKEAAVETICKMANLMRPAIRNQKLGENFKRMENMMHDKSFRGDCIETLALQMFDQDTIAGDAWKSVLSTAWKEREVKNRFLDMPTTQKAKPKDGETVELDPSQLKRQSAEWRRQVLAEAAKAYLNKHPLSKIESEPKVDAQAAPAADGAPAPPATDVTEVRYAVTMPPKEAMVLAIKEELAFHDTAKMVLAMRTRHINVKALRDELKHKTHGDIVSLLLKFEKMFKFKIMCELHGGDRSLLNLATMKNTKAMPEWWAEEWSRCLVEGTLKYGWGYVPALHAVECGFTATYKGVKKQRKPTKKELEQQKQLKAIESQMGDVQLAPPNGDAQGKASATPTPSPAQMIVKKRQWLQEGKKQEGILASICNHFRKELSTVLREAKTDLKKANKMRKLGISADKTAQEKAKKEKRERERAEKKERKRLKKEKRRREKEEKRKAKEAAAEAARPTNAVFAEANNITNYFSTALKNMPEGTQNAFEVLGKKKKERTPKKKKSKKEKYTKTKLVITFDEVGNFKVPIKISKGKMVKNLGVICAEPAYHGTNTIYPIGYKCCIASLPSFKRPGATATFTTEILRGEKGPVFAVTCSDDPEFKMTAPNPSKVWGELKVKWQEQKDTAEGKEKSETPKKGKASGPQKIGLAHPDIKRIVECMPGAVKCSNYKFKYRRPQDMDDALSPKKAFKKTLKIKREKTPKKKKPQPPSGDAHAQAQAQLVPAQNNGNSNSNSNSNSGNRKSDVIVIEDSPSASVPAPALAAMANGNGNGNVNSTANPTALAMAMAMGREGIDVSESAWRRFESMRRTPNVIDLCDSDEETDATKLKKTRKRKQPSDSDDVTRAELDADQQPRKKRKISD